MTLAEDPLGPSGGARTLKEEFERRWPAWARRLRPGLLRDQFEVYAGAPVLISGLGELLRDGHREIGRADAARLQVEGDEARGFVAGHPLRLTGVSDLVPPLMLGPRDDGVVCTDAEGRQVAVDISGEVASRSVAGAEMLGLLYLEPPLLVTASRFPELRSVTVYELATFFLPSLHGFTPLNGEIDTGAVAMVQEQAPFLRWLLDLLPRRSPRVAVDVGAGGGWLTGALGEAGASEALGFDLRVGDLLTFYQQYRKSDRAILALGDMFDWPLGDRCVDLILVRNSSALVFTDRFDAPFQDMFQAMGRSLRPGGILYLTFLTNCSGVEEASFSNIGLDEILAGLQGTGLEVVKMMRQGTGFGLVLTVDPRWSRLRSRVVAQRIAARDQYFVDDTHDEEVLRNWLVCLTDVTAEIGLRAAQTGWRNIELYGDPVMVAQVGVLLYEWYQAICRNVEPGGLAPENPTILRVDLGRRFGGRSREQADVRPFEARGARWRARACAPPWRFCSLSGDQDRPISQVLAARMPGRLRLLAEDPAQREALPEEVPELDRWARWRRYWLRRRWARQRRKARRASGPESAHEADRH